MKKLRKIVKYFLSVLILKRNNGHKSALNTRKRALNIQKGGGGGGPHPPPPPRFFLNNVRGVTGIDAKLGIPLCTSI